MNGFKVGTIRSVPITVHSTAALLAAFFAWAWGSQVSVLGSSTAIAVGAASAIGVLLSILSHELGHVAAAHVFGIRTIDVRLWGLGGMARLERPASTAGAEIVISAAGPLVSIALGGLLLLTAAMLSGRGMTTAAFALWFFVYQLGLWNVLIGLLNLAPGPPLDGGGIAAGIAWAVTKDATRACRIAAISGIVSAGIAVVLGISDVSFFGYRFDVMFFFVAVLLFMGSWPVLRPAQADTQPYADDLIRLLTDASRLAAERGDATIGSTHLLLALTRSGIEPLATFLYRHGLTYERVVQVLTVQPNPDQAPAGASGKQPLLSPLLSIGVKAILQSSGACGPGVLGVFLALPDNSDAANVVGRLGASLPALKTELASGMNG